MSEFSVAVDLSCLVPRPLTGVGYATLNLMEAALRGEDRPDFRFFASAAKPVPDDVRALGVRASRFRAVRFPTRWKNALWTRLEWPPLSRFVGETDIVHGTFHLLPPSHCARRVVTVHDLAFLRLSAIHDDNALATHRRLLDHAAPRADGIFVVSESCRQDVIELLGAAPEKVFVVPNGIVLAEFEGGPDESKLAAVKARHSITAPYLIHLGTLEPRKNLPRLIEAYARLRARHADAPQLVLAGGKGWMYAPIFEAVERHGLAGAVVWTDYLVRAEAVALLRGAFGCVYPSLYEGFGLPALEAMAARVPVLASNVSSLPEVVGDTGILVAPEDEESIEDGLERLVYESAGRPERIEAAWQRAQGMTWDHSAAKLMAAYRAVLGGAGPSA